MDSLNSTIINATTAIPPASHSLLAALGLGSLAGALGGAGSAGGLASVGLLLSSIVPLLMSTSSWIRGWAFGPFRWLLDGEVVDSFLPLRLNFLDGGGENKEGGPSSLHPSFSFAPVLFVSAYVKSSSPVYSWIVAYISSRPYKIHTSKKVRSFSFPQAPLPVPVPASLRPTHLLRPSCNDMLTSFKFHFLVRLVRSRSKSSRTRKSRSIDQTSTGVTTTTRSNRATTRTVSSRDSSYSNDRHELGARLD